MLFRGLADLVLVVHLAFIAFVVAGGVLVRRRRWVALLHLPCAVYGAAIEVGGWICRAQIALGAVVAALNVAVYAWALRRRGG
jgi:hypothetical protein